MTITAKFPGTCKKCNNPISAGIQIEWSKGSGAQHVTCPEQTAQAAKPVSNAPKFMRCRSCGQIGYTRQYPFSTNPGSGHCDDCN